MTRDMSSLERLGAVIRLDEPDRVPVGAWTDAFCATSTGITLQEWVFDADKAEVAFFKSIDAVGGFDVVHRPAPAGEVEYLTAWPARIKLPGRDLPADTIWQLDEAECMSPEEYDFIVDEGFPTFQRLYAERIGMTASPDDIAGMNRRIEQNVQRCRSAGIEPLLATPAVGIPYNLFTYARTLSNFLMDLYQRPEKVLAASEAAFPVMISRAIAAAEKSPVRRAMIGGARAAADFISPAMAATFFFPYMKRAVDALIDAEITPIIHMDNNFTRSLEQFKELPKGKCLLQLDGFTDIFKAKEVLGGHMALMGDVPAPLLALGTAEEITAYCRKLIDVVGADGGFILGAGCCIPANAKVENVQAMVSAAKEYGRYDRIY